MELNIDKLKNYYINYDPVILYRNDVDWKQEKDAAELHFLCIKSRMQVLKNNLVIPRFSALPFYKELEYDVNYVGAKLINSYNQHMYIADLKNWYDDLKEYTPETWFRIQDIPENGQFVLKGETNSKKFLWKTHMLAKNKKEAVNIESKLLSDSVIGYQNIYARKYIPLKTYLVGIQDLPITKEFRFFCFKDKILSSGYYWSSHVEELKELGISPNVEDVPKDFLNKIITIVMQNVNFFVIDVAETENGDWILIELNDGSQSGLSENNPEVMYKNLKLALELQSNNIEIC